MATEREHLERLVFEVHGVEEGKRMLADLDRATAEHEKSLKGLAATAKKAAREQADAASKSAKEQEAAAKKLADVQKRQAEATQKFAKLTIAALALVTAAAVKESSDREASLGRLERSFERAGGRVGEYARAINNLRDTSAALGLDFQAQADGLSQLLDQTGSVTKAESDLALAINIAAAENRDLAQTVEFVRKVRNGEVEEAKNLDGINKDLAQSLGKITDAGERSEKTIRALTEAYAGAADATKGTENQLAALKETGELALSVLGKLVIRVGSELADAFVTAADAITGTDVSLQNMNTSLSRLGTFIDEATLADLAELARGGGVLDIGGRTSGIIGAVTRKGQARQAGAGVGAPAGTAPTFEQEVAEPPTDEEIAQARLAEALKGLLLSQRPDDRKADPTAGSEALLQDTEDFASTWQAIWAQTYGLDVEAARAAEEEKRAIYNQTIEDQIASRAFLDAAVRETARIERAEAAIQKEKKEAQAEADKEASAKQREALSATASAGKGLTDSLIKDDGARAIIKGAIETAEAIAAAASLNIPGAIGHGAAAVAFFAAAAQAGVGGGGGAKAKGGGGGIGAKSAANTNAATRERESLALAGEGTRTRDQGARTLVVNFSNIVSPHPEQARLLADTLESEMRNRG